MLDRLERCQPGPYPLEHPDGVSSPPFRRHRREAMFHGARHVDLLPVAPFGRLRLRSHSEAACVSGG